MTADARLAPAAAAAWVAAALLIGAPEFAWPVAACTGLLTVIVLLLAGRSPGRLGRALAGVALATVGVGVLAVAVAAAAPVRSPAELTAFAGHPGALEVELQGIAHSSSLAAGPPRLLVPGTLRSFDRSGTRVSSSVPVLVFGDIASGGALTAGPGARISGRGTLQPTEPGDDVAYLVFLRGNPTLVAPPSGILAATAALRSGLSAAASTLPGDGGVLLPGLSIGDDSGVGEDLNDAMRSSSLSHLTAVSGANCVVVVAVVMLGGAAAGAPRGARIVLAGAALLAFTVLVTPQPSVLRATTMALLVLVALARGRPGGGLPTLCLAVLVLLAFDPWLSRSYGFALSALATAGLLVLARPLAELLAAWLPRQVAAAIAVPTAAQLACQPVLLLLNPGVPVYAVPANLLAEPAAPVATLLGLAACLLLPVLPPLGAALVWLAWAPSAWIAAVARFFAELPAGRLPWLEGGIGAVLFAALVGTAAIALLVDRRGLLASTVAVLLVVTGGLAGGAVIARARSPDWQLASCDVGQGDASLVRSDGQVALIDTGDDEEALLRCLDRLSIGRVDLLVLTHFDRDHVGAALALRGRADRLLPGLSDGPDADRLVTGLAAGGAQVIDARAGDTGTLGRLSWTVLWPRRDARVEPGNDASVVLRFEGDGIRSLYLGDLGEDGQRRLLATGSVGPVDVVKVAHHGSADQRAALYERLRARLGLISVGAGNDYGHPTEEALRLLAFVGTRVARTDLQGTLLVAAGPAGLLVWSERAPPAAVGGGN
jgi:competence protein ComEC